MSGDCAEVCFVLFDVLMTNVGEDERDDSICLEWKTDLVP